MSVVKMEKRKTFVFFADWHSVLMKYPMHLRCKVYDAIIMYAIEGKDPEKLEGEALMAFNFIREDIDRNNAKYEALCKRRKEWAKKGVEIRNNKAVQKHQEASEKTTLSKHKVAYATYNENENENENDIIYNDNNINNINNNNNINNKKKNFKIDFGLNDSEKAEEFILKIDKEQLLLSPQEFFNDHFLKGRGAGISKLVEEFGSESEVSKLAGQVMADWIARGEDSHKSVKDANDHMVAQMRIQHKYNNRKSKKYGRKKSNAESGSGEADRRRAPQACDFE